MSHDEGFGIGYPGNMYAKRPNNNGRNDLQTLRGE
jgi:hypothetical protein